MPGVIEIRQAHDAADRRAAVTVVYRANQLQGPLVFYQAVRLALPRRITARWWLLTVDGEPAVSLLCYPLELAHGEEPIAGFGLGSVASVPEHRKRGLASQLCEHAAEHEGREGRRVGLLFSAIAPAMYERLGYRVAPACDPSCTELAALRDSGPRAELTAIDPRASLDALDELYRGAHRGLHVRRGQAGWHASFAINHSDVFVAIGSSEGGGYARLYREAPETLDICELIVRDPSDRLPALRALAGLALELGCQRMHGWFPLADELRPWFHDAGRARRLPMVRGHADLQHSQFWSSDYF